MWVAYELQLLLTEKYHTRRARAEVTSSIPSVRLKLIELESCSCHVTFIAFSTTTSAIEIVEISTRCETMREWKCGVQHTTD